MINLLGFINLLDRDLFKIRTELNFQRNLLCIRNNMHICRNKERPEGI